MYKVFYALMVLVLSSSILKAQEQSSLDELLKSIETSNKTLAAYKADMEGELLKYKSENKLPDLQASAYFMPFGQHNTGNYTEFEVSQGFEFPSVYAVRAGWINNQEKRLDSEYKKLRQEILLKAQKLYLEAVYLQKLSMLVENRVSQSKKVFEQIQTLYEKGQAGILGLNKAKLVWLGQQFPLEELKTEEELINQKLRALNGGKELSLTINNYPSGINIPNTDSLWSERVKNDGAIVLLEKEKQVAEQNLKVAKNSLLPGITAGYNYQGVSGNNYSGFYGGLSIPLWGGKSKVKASRLQIDYIELHQSDVLTNLKNEYLTQIQRYQLLLKKFSEYEETLQGIDSEMLLQKSYELGEISFMEYFAEVSFYRDAENRMLEIEKELQQLRAELFKHQL